MGSSAIEYHTTNLIRKNRESFTVFAFLGLTNSLLSKMQHAQISWFYANNFLQQKRKEQQTIITTQTKQISDLETGNLVKGEYTSASRTK